MSALQRLVGEKGGMFQNACPENTGLQRGWGSLGGSFCYKQGLSWAPKVGQDGTQGGQPGGHAGQAGR